MPDGRSVEPATDPVPPATAQPAPPKADAGHVSAVPSPASQTIAPRRAGGRRWAVWIASGILALFVVIEGIPWLITAWSTVSTDDAYVNGHVTLVAPRVPGPGPDPACGPRRRPTTGVPSGV